jgi:hypothetical protein
MSECPVCDFPKDEVIYPLIDRIDDEDLQITLACDFAEHVADLTEDPDISRGWLDAARGRKENSAALERARVRAERARREEPREPGSMSAKTWAAIAVQRALWAALHPGTSHKALSETWNAAANAAWATEDRPDEVDWQVSHMRELACTCRHTPAAGPPCDRNRVSLLAS